MQLRTPGDLQGAIDEVDRLARDLADSLSAVLPKGFWGSQARQAHEAWLKWWAGADMKLRELFGEDDLLVPLAQAATEIVNLDLPARADEAPIVSFIIRQRDVWVDRLDNAARKLEQLKDFVTRPGRVAVLDTSAFQEFDPFWVADWAKVIEAGPPEPSSPGLPIRLVVPLVVVEELDDQKHHRDGRVRQRARKTLRHLRALERVSTDTFADILRLDYQVTMEILLDDPAHVRLPENDAEIINRAVELQSLFPASRRPILVSGDLSMQFRAEGAGLDTAHVSRDAVDDEMNPEN